MSWTNTPKTSVSAHLAKLYKMLLCFALGPIVSEKMKNKLFSPASGPTRTLRTTFGAGWNFPPIFDQLVHTVENKMSDTRVLQRLDSSHGKCSSPGPEECFYRQWCYLSAYMRLFLPTLVIVIVIWKVVLGSNVYPTRRKDKEISPVGSVNILLWRSGCKSSIATLWIKGPYQVNAVCRTAQATPGP